jgi:hypothetical protein
MRISINYGPIIITVYYDNEIMLTVEALYGLITLLRCLNLFCQVI